MLALGLAAFGTSAYATDDLQAGEAQDSALTTQASYATSYAILKSDGYLHRTNANHTQDYGTLWGDDEAGMWAALDSVTTLYIDSNVTSISDSVKVRRMAGSSAVNKTIEFTGNTLVTGPHNLRTIEFVLKDGKNQLQVISGSYSWYIFQRQTSLTTVKNLDKTQLVSIPDGMFCGCTSLTSISLPSTATTIGDYAFQDCKNLSSAVVPSGVATINVGAFEGCAILKSIDLPATVKKITTSAFNGCSSLSKVILRSSTVVDGGFKMFSETPIEDESGAGRIYVPNNLLDQYKSEEFTNDWRSYRDSIYPFFDVSAIAAQTYTGSAIKPAVTATWMGDTLAADNYTLSYANNVNVGTATVTATGKGAYAGYSMSRTFAITPMAISSGSITVSIDDQVYDGQAKTPNPTVKFGSTTLKNGTDYTVSYSSNRDVGTATATIKGIGNYQGTRDAKFNIKEQSGGGSGPSPEPTPTRLFMYRLYNPWSGEHFYTSDATERDEVMAAGWTFEGDGWVSPPTGEPVFRMYNRYGGEHHYTLDEAERDYLVEMGWEYEGIGWYSDPAKTIPLYRQYNPYAFSNNHNYTVSTDERDMLVGLGWIDEGIAWYGI